MKKYVRRPQGHTKISPGFSTKTGIKAGDGFDICNNQLAIDDLDLFDECVDYAGWYGVPADAIQKAIDEHYYLQTPRDLGTALIASGYTPWSTE